MSRMVLAYAVTLDKITPIPNKDKIAIASFKENEYDVIIQKDEYQEGDVIAYVEYDTVLPEWDEFEFLRKRCYKEKYGGFLISAMKMAGVVSYGIAFPLNHLKKRIDAAKAKAGMDLTKLLGVQSRDALDEDLLALASLKQSKKRSFIKRLLYRLKTRFPRLASLLLNTRKVYPYPIPKTDETRIEQLGWVYESWKDCMVDGTLKMDGQSIGLHVDDKGVFSLMSRSNVLFAARIDKLMKIQSMNLPLAQWLKKVDKLSNSANFSLMLHVLNVCHRDKWIAKMNDLLKGLKFHNGSFFIQGELCGPGIQKNPMGLKEQRIYIFNMSAKGQNYMSWDAMEAFVSGCFKLVPKIYHGEFKWDNKADIKSFANGLKYDNGALAEGVVFRKLKPSFLTYCEAERGMSNMASLKVISDEYALKHGS